MGDPKKQRKKYQTPSHPWQRARIEEEKILKKEYGVKNKKELWKMNSLLRNFKRQAKYYITATGLQAEKEKKNLIAKLQKYGFVKANAKIDDILSLTLKDIMEKRLQTLVFRKGLSRTIHQARQFIIHEHIVIGDRKVTVPSYLVKDDETAQIGFHQRSTLYSPEHPERAPVEKKPVEKKKEVKK